MPKTKVNYQNGIIYKICCKDPSITDVYVGSTTHFIKRKYHHKSACNNENNKDYKVYQFINNNGGWNNWDMIEIEKYACNDNNELKKKEREYIEGLNATLNCQIPTRTMKEYYEYNKDKIEEYKKVWIENNYDYHKQYYQNNKEKMNEKMKQWVENNKEYRENVKEYKKEKIQCDLCGSIITRGNLSTHKKSIKCAELKAQI